MMFCLVKFEAKLSTIFASNMFYKFDKNSVFVSTFKQIWFLKITYKKNETPSMLFSENNITASKRQR